MNSVSPEGMQERERVGAPEDEDSEQERTRHTREMAKDFDV